MGYLSATTTPPNMRQNQPTADRVLPERPPVVSCSSLTGMPLTRLHPPNKRPAGVNDFWC